jgi:hypothetical protein
LNDYLTIAGNREPGNFDRLSKDMGDDVAAEMVLVALRYDPNKRPSAHDLLDDPYFDDVRSPETEEKTISCMRSFLIRSWYPENGINNQLDITSKMVQILTDWLIEVWRMFKLTTRAFFYAQFLIDWAVSSIAIPQNQLQLVGIVCQIIAAKYCEVLSPEINDYIYISDKTYTKDQIIEMEQRLLKAFSYDLIFSVSYDFLLAPDGPDGVVNRDLTKLILMIITFSSVRFNLLPNDQYKLAAAITNAISNDSAVSEKWASHASLLKKDVSHINLLKSIDNYRKNKTIVDKSIFVLFSNLKV